MTTQQVATRLLELCNAGQWKEAQDELFHDDAISIEMEGVQGFPHKIQGKEAIAQKGEHWASMVEEVHKMHASDLVIAGDHFSCKWEMDTTMKGVGRNKSEEIAVFKVEDGKIVSEQFFYALD